MKLSSLTKQAIGLGLILSFFSIVACGGASHDANSGGGGGGAGAGAGAPPSQEELEAKECLLDGESMNCFEFATRGADLYTNNCVKCHDPIERSEVRGKTLAEFNDAISRVRKMSDFEFLSDDQRAAIVLALSL
jgi:hypothetical protein